MKKTNFILLVLLIITSCTNRNPETKIILLDSEEGRRFEKERQLEHYEREKKKYPSSTYDLLPISGDTLVAATSYNGIILSSDAGKSWKKLKEDELVSKLMLDDLGQLWGLYSWQGIHEEDKSILMVSKDLGKTWSTHELDTKKIFPAGFYSKKNEPLKVIDFNNKVFRILNIDSDLKWELVDSLTNEEPVYNPWESKEFITDEEGREWIFNSEGIFLIDSDTIKKY